MEIVRVAAHVPRVQTALKEQAVPMDQTVRQTQTVHVLIAPVVLQEQIARAMTIVQIAQNVRREATAPGAATALLEEEAQVPNAQQAPNAQEIQTAPMEQTVRKELRVRPKVILTAVQGLTVHPVYSAQDTQEVLVGSHPVACR